MTASPTSDVPPAAHPSLRQLEEWFVHAMTHGESAEAGAAAASTHYRLPALDALLTRSARRSAYERFDVYHDAYRARLLECLADDYPVLRRALGERFDSLCHTYVARHPSRSFSLNGYGAQLPVFLRDAAPAPAAFFAELARLEWALVEAVHAAAAPVLSLEEVSAVPPTAWEHAVLEPAPALTLHRFDYPVNAYFKRVKADEDAERPALEPCAVAVCRRDFTVWRVDLSPSGATALAALMAGEPLLAALTRAEARPEDVSQWFRTWMECGFFRAVHARG